MKVVAKQTAGIVDPSPEGGIAVAAPVPLEETPCCGMTCPVLMVSLQESSGPGAVFTTAKLLL